MDFFTIVIILAIVILILLLTYIGVAMSKLNTSQIFPPNANVCPDYWVEVEPGKCQFPAAQTRNTGDFTIAFSKDGNKTYIGSSIGEVYGNTVVSGTTDQLKEVIRVNDETVWTNAYPGVSAKCAKKKWASSHGIAWDGITNSNGC